MKNFIQPGNTITVVSPAIISSGDGVLIQNLFGVAAYDAIKKDPLELLLEGVFFLPKAGIPIAQGARVYWDNNLAHVTTVAQGNTLIGVATADTLLAETSVEVRLNGAF